jgi:hypothetical protein
VNAVSSDVHVEDLDEIESRVRADRTPAAFEAVVVAALGRLFEVTAVAPPGRGVRRRLVARRAEGSPLVVVDIGTAPADPSEVLALARGATTSDCTAALVTWRTGTEPSWDRDDVARRALREYGVVIDVVHSAGSLVAKVSMFGPAPPEETVQWVQAEVRRNRATEIRLTPRAR